MKPFLTCLALASLLLFGCEPEGQDIAFKVNVTQWASPNLPEVGATVVLEEQRLTNGVLNSFFTEIERVTTPESGVVELQTVRSNVLALRIRVEQINCFDEIVDLNPEDVVIDGTPNVVDVSVMPQCLVNATIDNTASLCPNYNMNFKWTPREVEGAASEVRFTCGTDWQTVGYGDAENAVCYITGGTWLLHRRFWGCVDSTNLDSVWCAPGGVVMLDLD